MISTVFRATASSSGSQGVAFAGAVRSSSRRSMTRPPQTAVGVSLLCQYRRENSALLNQRHTVGDSPVAEGACPYQGEVGRKGKVGHKAKVGHKGKVGRSHQPTWFVPTKCETAPHPAQRGILRRTDPPQQPAAQRAGPRRVPRPPFGGEGARRAGEGENRPNHKALTRNTARLAGADLCVRSVGLGSEERRAAGQPKNLDRKPQCVPHREHPSKGSSTRAAGGADLRVRSAGLGSEENRSHGQPSRIYCSTFSCSTLSASGRADLRVRSAGLGSAENRSLGQPKNPDRKAHVCPPRTPSGQAMS
jgi:hypothetical protein